MRKFASISAAVLTVIIAGATLTGCGSEVDQKTYNAKSNESEEVTAVPNSEENPSTPEGFTAVTEAGYVELPDGRTVLCVTVIYPRTGITCDFDHAE